MKKCKICQVEKIEFEFYKKIKNKDGLMKTCKKCHWQQVKRCRKSNSKYKIRQEKYYLRLSKEERKNQCLKATYGIDIEEYNKILKIQEGKCIICKLEKKLCVDHDHKTGKIRGLLCGNCNTLIGHAHEDIKVLKSAINYLQ